jgi:hypothetical protein
MQNFYHGKREIQNWDYLCNLKNPIKVNSHKIGENSPNILEFSTVEKLSSGY